MKLNDATTGPYLNPIRNSSLLKLDNWKISGRVGRHMHIVEKNTSSMRRPSYFINTFKMRWFVIKMVNFPAQPLYNTQQTTTIGHLYGKLVHPRSKVGWWWRGGGVGNTLYVYEW